MKKGWLQGALCSGLIMALGIILTYHLSMFWAYGRVEIFEDNLIIRGIETFLGVAIFGFGIYILIKKKILVDK